MTQAVFAGDAPRDFLDPQIGHVEPGDTRDIDDALIDADPDHWTVEAPAAPAKKTSAPKPTTDSSATADATSPQE